MFQTSKFAFLIGISVVKARYVAAEILSRKRAGMPGVMAGYSAMMR
jgi:hypothetical protein